MKTNRLITTLCLVFPLLFGIVCSPLFAQTTWKAGTNSPIDLLDSVVKNANQDSKIQDTVLDGVTSQTAGYSGNIKFRITNTLDWIKNNIHPYIQWAVYLGLAIATILLIYNGFLMVTNAVNGEKGEFSKIKGNFINIAIGVILLTGFYYLIDFITAVINFLFE
ncbi:MAG: hypothetical protein LBP53_06555 [Candidatus Peribacteria bacterium]|jgi:hypothetical protein|nr:hypothetical protein [Candidatus Peribacteria bacterium]